MLIVWFFVLNVRYSLNLYTYFLQAVEIEFLIIWHNPGAKPELMVPGEENIATWRSKPVTEKNSKDYIRLAWGISPILAVFVPERIKNDTLIQELKWKIRLDPLAVSHIPQALQYLATTDALLSDSSEVRNHLRPNLHVY